MESIVSTESAHEEKWIKHYSSRHKILLIGEGDFSFAACLARAFGDASNMVATSLDSQELLREKHPAAADNLAVLKEKGCTIMHEVDARTMSHHPLLIHHRKFDRIVFNFPHAGFVCPENNCVQISLHQEVVRGFLKNAYEMVAEKGEVHITHKTSHPYCEWEIEMLAREADLRLAGEEEFEIYEFPGYINRRGAGYRSNQTFPVGKCSTFMFAK